MGVFETERNIFVICPKLLMFCFVDKTFRRNCLKYESVVDVKMDIK